MRRGAVDNRDWTRRPPDDGFLEGAYVVLKTLADAETTADAGMRRQGVAQDFPARGQGTNVADARGWARRRVNSI